MTRLLLSLLTLLLPVAAAGQTLYTSKFAETWVTLQRPEPIQLEHRLGGDVSETGDYEFAMSWVDERGRVSPLSDPVKLTATLRSWGCSARLAKYPVWTRAVGWVLWCRRVGGDSPAGPGGPMEYEWRPAGGQGNCQNSKNVTRPILPMCGWESHLLRAHGIHRAVRWFGEQGQTWPKYEDNAFWPKSPSLEKPKLPPIVRLFQFPNKKHRVAISWACTQGETPLCDPLTIEQQVLAKWPHQIPSDDAEYSQGSMLWLGGNRPPQGALGIYVYVQWDGETQWHRQQTPSGDGYLWPFINRIPLGTYTASGIGPSATPGKSLLSPLQMAIESGNSNIVVETDQTIYCPVQNPLSNGYGGCIGRTITAPHGTRWKLKTNSMGMAETEWPLWVESTQETKLVNCSMESGTAVGGIEFCGYHDSSCFYFRADGLRISLGRPGYNAGIRQLWEARSLQYHTCSEPIFSDVGIGGIHPIVCEGNQSANWLIRNAAVNCTGGIESAVMSGHNSGTMQITERLILTGSKKKTAAWMYAAAFGIKYDIWSDPEAFTGGRAIWANISTVTPEADRIFVDQGFPCWLCVGGLAVPSMDMWFTKVNHWHDWLHVVEAPNGSKLGQTQLRIRGQNSQYDPAVVTAYAGRTNGVKITKDAAMGLLKNLSTYSAWPAVLP